MDVYVLRGKIKGHFKTKKGLILILLFLLLVSLGVSIVLVQRPQILKKFAQVSTGTGTCRWQAVSSADRYRYVIQDETAGGIVSQGETETLAVNFELTFGHTYSCSVFAVNECGLGPQGRDADTCRLNVTPSPTPSPSPTPTPTETPIPTATPTLAPGITPIETLTPTLAPGITPTETPIPTVTPQPTNTPVPTATPTPLAEELPESGFFTSTYLLLVSGVVSILGGMLLLKVL